MIRINGFLHREKLYDLARRWMLDQPQPDDAGTILYLVHFNNLAVSRYLSDFSGQLFSALHRCELSMEKACTKGDLKDRIIAYPLHRTARFRELFTAYSSNPGDYYRDTPFHGSLYFCEGGGRKVYIGSSRIKRIRRLTEKSARRLVDWMFHEIQQRADKMTDERATRPGVLHQELITPLDEMVGEFTYAERELLHQLREKRPTCLPDNLEINDVAGVKVILDSDETERLLAVLEDHGCRVVEKEQHQGNYSAINLVVEYRFDKESILSRPLNQRMIRLFRDHGVSEDKANRAFKEFVRSGEESVYLEIIVSNYIQMLESEIGNCMHEERIIRQRQNQRYLGQLAQNVEFLMEYIFTFPASSLKEIERLPVRLWDRYLPDYFDEVRRKLFHIPSVEFNEL